ncbi:MAG: AMP phosphorylase [Candidatus Hadarchaeales archaeon]
MKSIRMRVRPLDLEAGRRFVLLHESDAELLGYSPGDRVRLTTSRGSMVAMASTTARLVGKGEIGSCVETTTALGLRTGDEIEISLAPRPRGVDAIRKKVDGRHLSSEEIGEIIRDIVSESLTSEEISAFVVAEHIRGMSMDEIVAMIHHMVETGDRLELDVDSVSDVHSIGGVPGNKYALVTVPIAAAAGLVVPKTSSRAITSAAGTADVMEVLANVSFSLDEMQRIVKKVGAVLAWGGSVRLAPADDILIQVERVLGLDPRCQLLASVMSKKLAVGANQILIDIPTGPGAKVESMDEARALARDFIQLSHRLDVRLEAAITYGGQPVGYAVGPALEAREALETLMGKGPGSLIEKATSLAGIMLELGGVARLGGGKEVAEDILKSGRAYRKMREIIEAQGGNPDIQPGDVPVGDKVEVIPAPASGYVAQVFNQRINEIARAAGAPVDKGAGLRILMKEGRKVEKGEPLLEIYAEHEGKLDHAISIAKQKPPIRIEGMVLEKVTGEPRLR